MKTFFLFLFTFLLFSCKQKNKNILPADKMEKILWDITQADIFIQDFIAKDSAKNLPLENLKIQQKIFAKHKTNRKEFYKSYEFYIKHEELLKPLLDSMVVKNGRIREAMRLKQIKEANEQVKKKR